MKKTLWKPIVALALAGGLFAEATAQTNPNQLILWRKGAMGLHAKYFGPIVAMTQGRVPYDAATVQRNADYLVVLSQLPWDDFQPSTIGATTSRTKEEAFKDTAKFKGGIDAMQSEVRKLAAAARAGDQGAVGAVVKTLGEGCNSCHEAFATFDFKVYRAQ